MKVFNREPYLESSLYIDWKGSAVKAKAEELAQGIENPLKIAEKCFLFVRDEILHSLDHKLNPVTCKASEVLEYGTGCCYAKSHLLAALLRANGIPAGLCYQRLTLEGDGPPYSLHGLNAAWFEEYGWYRFDARGNKEDIKALFSPPLEKLAFPVQHPGEKDLPEILHSPLSQVIEVLTRYKSYDEVKENLPDLS